MRAPSGVAHASLLFRATDGRLELIAALSAHFDHCLLNVQSNMSIFSAFSELSAKQGALSRTGQLTPHLRTVL